MGRFFSRAFISITLVFCIALSFVPVVYAQEESEVKRYIVIMEEPALYSPERPVVFAQDGETYIDEVRNALVELQNDVKEQISPSVGFYAVENEGVQEYSFTDVLNGFTITTDAGTAEAISKIDGVKEVFPDEIIATVSTEEMSLLSDGEITEAASDTVIEETVSSANSGNTINTAYAYGKGYTGEGRAVAILDSTINYEKNPYFALTDENTVKYTVESLADTLTQKGIDLSAEKAYRNAKVPFAYDYASDSYTLKTDVSQQHGTHVSGIAAGYKTPVGDGIIRGIAPEAQILFFGVESSGGGVLFSDATAALNDAVKLGADAANMSFGDEFTSENSTSKTLTNFRNAVINAENAGCSVNASAGNADRGGCIETKDIDYSVSDNTHFPNATKVGSVHGNYRVAGKLTDGADKSYAGEIKSTISTFPLTEIVDCKSGTAAEISQLSLTGKVAVIQKPDDIIAESDLAYYNRAVGAGAAAVIFVNNIDQVLEGIVKAYSVPVFYVTKSEGEKILANATQLSCIGKLMIAHNSDAPRASFFSSYGYSDTLDISVDFAAPGGNVYSSFNTGFTNISGTSMAAPQITGSCVLMYQYVEEAFPTYSGKNKVKLVRNLLASTAENVYENNGALASVRKVGSGVVQLDKAMQSSVILHNGEGESRITLGDEVGKEFTLSFYAENLSDESVTFDKIEVEASTDDYKYYEAVDKYAFCGIKELTVTADGDGSVVIEPNSVKEVSLTVTLNDDDIAYLNTAMVNGFFVDGKVTLSDTQGGHCSVGIPFTGFYGDWEKLAMLDETQISSNLKLMSDIGACTVYCELEEADNGYLMPFTITPDETVRTSPLSLSMLTQRNSFVQIKANGSTVYNGFAEKKTAAVMKEFVKTNGVLSELLKQDGNVTLEFAFRTPLDETGENAQKITVTVMPQNTKPVFEDICVIEQDGTRYAKMTVSGNSLNAIVRTGHNSRGESVSGAKNINSDKLTVAWGVEGFNDASFYVYDSALNSASVEHDISIEVTVDNKAVIKNTTINDISGVCLIAVYDDSGRMENVAFLSGKDAAFAAYGKMEVDISEYADKRYKIFFWKDTSSLEPHCGAYE